MRTTIHIALFVLASMVAVACHSAEITHCPDLDCPKEKVCDGNGGCAFPQQLDICKSHADGDACTYTDRTGQSVAGQCTKQVCYPLGCGNGFVTPDEAGEQCDDGNTIDGDGCQHNCDPGRCGDGIVDPVLGEECDAGDSNSTAPNAACRPNCQLPRCGDGVMDTAIGEKCDDGNNQSSDGCSGDCRSTETCGNSVVDALAGEVCDDGNTVS